MFFEDGNNFPFSSLLEMILLATHSRCGTRQHSLGKWQWNVIGFHWAGNSVQVGIVTIDSFCPIRKFVPPETDLVQYMNDANVKMVVFDCPFGDVVLWPDLLITINFTALRINATFPLNTMSDTVSIVVGMYMDILDMIHNTWAIPLVPDAHLFGGVIWTIWEQFKSLRSAPLVLNVLQFMTSSQHPDQAMFVMPDKGVPYICCPVLVAGPFIANSSRQQHCEAMPVFRRRLLTCISVEYREKSVLSGISAMGGFWTVLNGLFATVFGMTLMFFLFGKWRAPLHIAYLTRIFRHQASLNVRVDT